MSNDNLQSYDFLRFKQHNFNESKLSPIEHYKISLDTQIYMFFKPE